MNVPDLPRSGEQAQSASVMNRAWVIGLVVSAACGGGHGGSSDASIDSGFQDAPIDAPALPVFRNPVSLPDDQLALQAMQILGADVPQTSSTSCNSCHGMTRQHLSYWRALGETAMSTCLTDLQVQTQESALAMINCLRAMPDVATSDFMPQNLGIFATAARLPWFDYTFWKAYGADAEAQKALFITEAAMPHGDTVTPLTQAQFDIVAEWFTRGLPQINSFLPQDPEPTTCTPGISSDVAAHTTTLATTGWRAVNHDNNMMMFDCAGATDPKQCMTNQALASTKAYGTTWDVATHGNWRVLDDVTYRSAYWTRSSPDGRFVGHGVSNTHSSMILDLQRSAAQVSVAALYDPGFFPDGSGFVFQAGTNNMCPISVLTSNPSSVSMTEAGCTNEVDIGLYQHVGKALNGGDYFTIDSQFVSDDGGHSATLRQPYTQFDSQAASYFNPFVFNGTSYVHGTQVKVPQAFEGDSVLSPSATLELTRISGPNSKQLGYVLHKVNAVDHGASGFSVDTPEIARYCMSGGKVAFSYDERWVVYHHYVTSDDAVEMGYTGSTDPAFAQYLTRGAANIYLMDLATGVPKRITNMQPGQYALMPHFRSDGWIYANVRDTTPIASVVHEYFIASDAALLAE